MLSPPTPATGPVRPGLPFHFHPLCRERAQMLSEVKITVDPSACFWAPASLRRGATLNLVSPRMFQEHFDFSIVHLNKSLWWIYWHAALWIKEISQLHLFLLPSGEEIVLFGTTECLRTMTVWFEAVNESEKLLRKINAYPRAHCYLSDNKANSICAVCNGSQIAVFEHAAIMLS